MRRPVVVLSPNLLNRNISAISGQGWFSGARIKSEDTFIVYGTQVDDEYTVSEAFARLAPHRAVHFPSGEYEEKLLQWCVVKPGFNERFKTKQELRKEEFHSLISPRITDVPRLLIAIEEGPERPVATAIRLSATDERVRTKPVDIVAIGKSPNPFSRFPEGFTSSLETTTAAIVGLGSGGAEIALDLACSGVGRLLLFDDDRLQPENYFRFLAGRSDLGRYKVDVVASQIEDRELPTEVLRHPIDVVASANRFRKILEDDCDIFICATDSIASRRVVNIEAIRRPLPCVIAGTLSGGVIGEVLRVAPYESACYECARLQLGAALDLPADQERSATPYIGTEEVSLAGAALRLDISIVAALASRVVLHVLDPIRFSALPTNYIVWGREANSEYSNPFRFGMPFSTNYVQLGRRKDCPVCGVAPTELMGVDIEAEARKILSDLDALDNSRHAETAGES